MSETVRSCKQNVCVCVCVCVCGRVSGSTSAWHVADASIMPIVTNDCTEAIVPLTVGRSIDIDQSSVTKNTNLERVTQKELLYLLDAVVQKRSPPHGQMTKEPQKRKREHESERHRSYCRRRENITPSHAVKRLPATTARTMHRVDSEKHDAEQNEVDAPHETSPAFADERRACHSGSCRNRGQNNINI